MKKFLFLASMLGSVSLANVAAATNLVDQPSSKPAATGESMRKPLDVVCITQGCDNGTSATGCGSNAAEAKQALATALAFGCDG